jgi:hypothetical protein
MLPLTSTIDVIRHVNGGLSILDGVEEWLVAAEITICGRDQLSRACNSRLGLTPASSSELRGRED